jgi:hypothetical protein
MPFLQISGGARGMIERFSSPQSMRRINGWLTIFWVVMVPVSYEAGWLDSVVYVSALSLWALVSGHWAAWQAARVEVRQDLDNDVAEVLEEMERLSRRLRLMHNAIDTPPTRERMQRLSETADEHRPAAGT